MATAVLAPRPVLADLIPHSPTRYRIEDLAQTALLILTGALVTAALAQVRIYLPDNPVPITGQTLGVVLTGAALGPLRGMLAQLTYVAMGLFLPFYAGGKSGVDVIYGATGGYLIGFIVAAFIIGLAAKYGFDRQPWKAAAISIAGLAVVYAFGVPWLAAVADYDAGTAIAKGMTPFLLGEVIKAAIAAMVLPAGWWLARRLRGREDDA